MAPPPVGTIASIANLQVRNMPRPSMAITSSQLAAVTSITSPSGMMPALATSTSSRPKRSAAAPIIRRASSSTETSPTTVSTSVPPSRSSSASASSGSP
jgi:hypothetical protein